MGEGDCEIIETSKKGRHRKKQLYNSILQQMEFYFSDSNLTKDRFLSKLIADNPYVDIKVFLSFNKIRRLNCTVEDICKAISKSELIEVSEDKEKICRKTPLKIKENIDECTIYVENIKADANHEWLKQVFSDFGNVVYVSIPKYKQNKGNKGFAFIEFETENEAQNALDYFENIGCKMPSSTNPECLRSIITFEEDGSKNQIDIKSVDKNSAILERVADELEISKKRKLSDEDVKQEKKLKVDLNVDCEQVIKKENIKPDNTETKNEEKEKCIGHVKETKTEVDLNIEPKNDNKIENAEPDDMENKKKKKPKKDKKKNYIKELGLQILSKKEWKKMRNRYLDLQKKKMKEFKQYLYKHKNHKCEKFKKIKDDNTVPIEENNVADKVPVKLEYIPGVIVKLKLPEPCMDVKKLKSDIKIISPEVKYVDIPLSAGGEEIYIRFSSSDGAKRFCEQEFTGDRTILESEEEKSYWDKLQNDRSIKFTKSVKKQRGRDKLLKKAEKERAKHIRFDEGE